jgi:hypothetical protein
MTYSTLLFSDFVKEKKWHFCLFKTATLRVSCLVCVVPVGRGGSGERVWEGEYGSNTVYTCMKMEKK